MQLTDTSIHDLLSNRIYKRDIKDVVNSVAGNRHSMESLYNLTKSPEDRLSVNAFWCLSYLSKFESVWLQSIQNELIDRLLTETHITKKRILLQILRAQSYVKEPIRIDFLDYCLSKINLECEPYAIRCFCIYCAFKLCRHYPEFITELEEYLEMLSSQNLSPGLQCALRTTRRDIKRLNLRYGED